MTATAIPREQLDAMIGKPMGDGEGGAASDPVNVPMIRHWVAAFDDHNPVYLDEDAAASSRHGALVAPPVMLQTWVMSTPTLDGIGERGGAPRKFDRDNPLTVFDEAGFGGSLATNSELEFDRYLHPGEVITTTSAVESISDEKQTRLGRGHFITWVTTYRVGDEVVGRQRFRMLKFRPGEEA